MESTGQVVEAADAVVVSTRSRWVQRRGPQFGMAAIAAAFLLLLGVVIAGSVAINDSANEAERAVILNSAYQHAASGVAAEESLERKYRLEPGPAPLEGHTAAEGQ